MQIYPPQCLTWHQALHPRLSVSICTTRKNKHLAARLRGPFLTSKPQGSRGLLRGERLVCPLLLICALRRIGLAHTQFAAATCGTIRLKLLKSSRKRPFSRRRSDNGHGCSFSRCGDRSNLCSY